MQIKKQRLWNLGINTACYLTGCIFLFVRFSYYKSCDTITSNGRSIKIDYSDALKAPVRRDGNHKSA